MMGTVSSQVVACLLAWFLGWLVCLLVGWVLNWLGTCGDKGVFRPASEAPVVAKWNFCLYLGHFQWRSGISACIWDTCCGEMQPQQQQYQQQ